MTKANNKSVPPQPQLQLQPHPPSPSPAPRRLHVSGLVPRGDRPRGRDEARARPAKRFGRQEQPPRHPNVVKDALYSTGVFFRVERE